MNRGAEAPALLDGLLSDFDMKMDEVRGQSSLVVAAFVEAQPEGAPSPEGGPAARPVFRVRIPERVRGRLSTLERVETTMPADSPDPVVRRLLTGLNRYHLWLTVEAMNSVSKYYLSLFAVLGYLDPELWPCSSYGDLRMSEVGTKPIAWFAERAAAFVESCGLVGVADALTDAVPALKRGADVKTLPGVWFRGTEPLRKFIEDRHGSATEAVFDQWMHDSGMEAGEALRVLGVLSCVFVNGDETTLWLIDANQTQSSDQRLTKRFDLLMGRAEECVHAAHVASLAYFGHSATIPQQDQVHLRNAPAPQQPGGHAQKQEIPRGKDPSFVPIRLQEPAGRYRPVKGTKS